MTAATAVEETTSTAASETPIPTVPPPAWLIQDTAGVQAGGSMDSAGTGAQSGSNQPAAPQPVCRNAPAYGPVDGKPGLLEPQIRLIDGLRYGVYMRTCDGIAEGTTVLIPLFTTEDLAEQARDRITRKLPKPKPFFAGDPSPWQFVAVPTIIWTNPATWQPFTLTVTAMGNSATITVTPRSLIFNPGDDTPPVRCDGPGVEYTERYRRPQSEDFDPQPGQCGHIYRASSAKQPDLAYPATVSVEWTATWTASDGTNGTLDPVLITTATPTKVARVQAIGSA
jgi:hypothetical protein